MIAALPRLWAITDVGLRGDEAVYAGQAGVLAGRPRPRSLLRARLARELELPLLSAGRGARLSDLRRVGRRRAAGRGRLQPRHGAGPASSSAGRCTRATSACSAASFFALSGYSVLLGQAGAARLDARVPLHAVAPVLREVAHDAAGPCGCTRSRPRSALTIQAKVTGGLVLVIALNYLLVSRQLQPAQRAPLAAREPRVHRVLHPGAGADRAQVRPAARVPGRQRRPGGARALVLLPRQAHLVRGLRHAADLAGRDRASRCAGGRPGTACSCSGCSSRRCSSRSIR